MTHLTTLDELKQHITLLVSVEESDALFVSFYLNLEDGGALGRAALAQRASVLRHILMGNDLADLEQALPGPGWTCAACKAMGTDMPKTPLCPQCDQASVRPLDVKEALPRLAGQFAATSF